MKGKFIVFEGIDGSGKSTQLDLLLEKMMSDNKRVMITKEPWDGHEKTYRKIRDILDKKIVLENRLFLEMLLFVNRFYHSKWMKSLLENDITILCDRYWFSSIAYQEFFPEDLIKDINHIMLYPDTVVYVKLDGKEAIKRIEKRGEGKTLYEKEGKLNDANNRYLNFFKNMNNTIILDGTKSIPSIFLKLIESLGDI